MSDREQQSEVEKIEAQRMKQQRQQAQQMLPAWKVQQLRQRSEKLFECPSPRVGSWAVKKARASDSDGRDDASSSLLSSSVRPSSSAAARGGGGAGAGAGAGAGGGFSSRRGRAAAASVSASGPRAKSSWKSRNNNDSNGADDTSGRAPPTPGEYSDKEQKLLAKLNRKLVLQRKPNRVKSGLRNHHFKAGPAVVNTTKLGVLAARQPRPKVIETGPTTDIDRVLSAPARLRVRSQLTPFGDASLPVKPHLSRPEDLRLPVSDPSIAAGGRVRPKQSEFAIMLQADLPRSIYIVDEELPTRGGKALVGERARSRWNLPGGDGVRWRRCTIIGFDEVSETYEIAWDFMRGKRAADGATKRVRRSNLLLAGEDDSTLQLFQDRRVRQVAAMEAAAEFKFLRDAPGPSHAATGRASELDISTKANVLRLAGIDIKKKIPYEKAESLQQVFTEVNEDFERAMKTSRAEAIWIATHVHADQDTSLFAIQDSSRRRRFDIGVRFDMRACKRSLGAVNRRLRYTNLLMNLVSQMALIPLLPTAPWAPGPREIYDLVRKGRPVPSRVVSTQLARVPVVGAGASPRTPPYELPYTLENFQAHFQAHFAAAEAILLNNATSETKQPDGEVSSEASLLTKTADLVLDFYSEECDRLSRKFMENRRAKKAPFLRTLFLANQLRWDTMKQSISSAIQKLCDVVCGRAHTFLRVQDSLGLERFGGAAKADSMVYASHRRAFLRRCRTSTGKGLGPRPGRIRPVREESDAEAVFLTDGGVGADDLVDQTTAVPRVGRPALQAAICRKMMMLVDNGYFEDVPHETPSLFVVDLICIAQPEHGDGYFDEAPENRTSHPPRYHQHHSRNHHHHHHHHQQHHHQQQHRDHHQHHMNEGQHELDTTKPSANRHRHSHHGKRDRHSGASPSHRSSDSSRTFADVEARPMWGAGVPAPPDREVLRFEPPLKCFVEAIEAQINVCVDLGVKMSSTQFVDVVLINDGTHPYAPKSAPLDPDSVQVQHLRADVRAGIERHVQRLDALQEVVRGVVASIVLLDERRHHLQVGFHAQQKSHRQRLFAWTHEMEYIRELRSRVEWTIPSHVLKVGELFSVRIDKLRQILLQKLDTVRQNMLNQFSKELGQQCAKCLRRYGPAVQHMRSAAETFDEYEALSQRLAQQPQELNAAWTDAASIWQQLELLNAHHHELLTQQFQHTVETVNWPQLLKAAVAYCEEHMPQYHAALSETLSGQVHDFDGLMSEFEQATYEMTNLGLADVSGADLYLQQASNLYLRLESALKDSAELNRCRVILGQEKIDYDLVIRLMDLVRAVKTLWHTHVVWTEQLFKWRSSSLLTLENVDEHIRAHQRQLHEIQETFFGGDARLEPALRLQHHIAASIDDFSKYLPLIRAMHTPGIGAKHRAEIVEILGLDLQDGVVLTLDMMIALDALSHVEAIVNICSLAGLEHAIKAELASMQEAWIANTSAAPDSPEYYSELRIPVGRFDAGPIPPSPLTEGLMQRAETPGDRGKPKKKTKSMVPLNGRPCLLPLERLVSVVDIQLRRCQDILRLPFGHSTSRDVLAWMDQLASCDEFLRRMEAGQRQWCEVALFFRHPEALATVPHLVPAFNEADELWAGFIKSVEREPRILQLVRQETTCELLDNFFVAVEGAKSAYEEFIQRHVRRSPRMFLMTPDSVQRVLGSRAHESFVGSTRELIPTLFPGVVSLELGCEDSSKVVAVRSAGQRRLPLHLPVDLRGPPPESDSAPDATHVRTLPGFINAISNAIDSTLRQSLKLALTDVVQNSTSTHPNSAGVGRWLLAYPPQIALAVMEYVFTQNMERALMMVPCEQDLQDPNVGAAVASGIGRGRVNVGKRTITPPQEDLRRRAFLSIKAKLVNDVEALLRLRCSTTQPHDIVTLDAAICLTLHQQSNVESLVRQAAELAVDAREAVGCFHWLVQRRVYVVHPDAKPKDAEGMTAEEHAALQGMSDETRLEFIENTKKAKIAARLQFSFELDAGVLDLLHQQGFILDCQVGPASRQFGFEYLGDIPRLPITPSTLRATHTLFRAFQCRTGVHLTCARTGGSVGRALVRDIASSLGVHCISTVCRPRENFATVLQAIKATAALGWWCLFEGLQNVDHFEAGFSTGHEGNIFSYLALAARSVLPVIDPGKVKICKMLDATPVFAQPTFALIITDSIQPSNLPLAAFNGDGSSSLSAHVRAMFRPLAVTNPHLERIADARLFCEGFSDHSQLAKRLVACVAAASERLVGDREFSAAAVMRDLPFMLRVIRRAADVGVLSEQAQVDHTAERKVCGPNFASREPNLLASIPSRDIDSTRTIANGELCLCMALLHESMCLLGHIRACKVVPCCIRLYFSSDVAATVAASAALRLHDVEAAEPATVDDLGLSNSDANDNDKVIATIGECVRRSARAITVRRSRYKRHSVVLDAARDELIALADAEARRCVAAKQAFSFASSWSSVGAPPAPSSSDAAGEHLNAPECAAGVSHGDVPVPIPGNKPLGRVSQDCAAHDSVVEQALRLFEVLYGTDIGAMSDASPGAPTPGRALIGGAVLAGGSCSGKTFATTALAHALSDSALPGAGVRKRRVQLVRVFPDAFSVESLLGTARRISVHGQVTRTWQNGILEKLFFSDWMQRESTRDCWYNRTRLATCSSLSDGRPSKKNGKSDGSADSDGERSAREPDSGSESEWSNDEAFTSCESVDAQRPATVGADPPSGDVLQEADDALWVVFDGPVAAPWVEVVLKFLRKDGSTYTSMSPGQRDLRYCLAPGPVLDAATRVLFETQSLEDCSPTLLQHLGFVHFSAGSCASEVAEPSSQLFTWSAILDAFSSEVDIFAQIGYQEFHRTSAGRVASHIVATRKAEQQKQPEDDEALVDENTLDCLLRKRFHLPAGAIARRKSGIGSKGSRRSRLRHHASRRHSFAARAAKEADLAVLEADDPKKSMQDSCDAPDECNYEFEPFQWWHLDEFCTGVNTFFKDLFRTLVTTVQNSRSSSTHRTQLAVEFVATVRALAVQVCPHRVNGYFTASNDPQHLREVARNISQRNRDDGLTGEHPLRVEQACACELDPDLDFLSFVDARRLANSPTDFLQCFSERLKAWGVLAAIWTIGGKCGTQIQRQAFHDALCAHLREISSSSAEATASEDSQNDADHSNVFVQRSWVQQVFQSAFDCETSTCFEWWYDPILHTVETDSIATGAHSAPAEPVQLPRPKPLRWQHTATPHFLVTLPQKEFVPLNSIVKMLLFNGESPMLVAGSDMSAAEHLRSRIVGTLPVEWCTVGRAVVETTTSPEVFAGDIIEQCISTGVSRRAAAGRTRLLLLIDDVSDSAASDKSAESHRNTRSLLRQLLQCHGIPTPEMLCMAESGQAVTQAVLGQYKSLRTPTSTVPASPSVPHELLPEVVEASRAATASYSPLIFTVDHEIELQANASCLGVDLQHAAFFPISATEPVDRLRQHCVCIHTGAMDDQDEVVLQQVLEQTLEPLFNQRRPELCINQSDDFSAAAIRAVPATALATAKLFCWIQQHFIQEPKIKWLPAHFCANRHHLSRIVQGLASVSPQFVDTERGLMRAWVHECARVFEDQLTTLAQIQEYRRAVVGVMQAAFHAAYPSHKLAVRRRKFVTTQVQKEHSLLALFQKLSQHKVRRALLFWRAYVWQTPEDTGGSEDFFFAPASKALTDPAAFSKAHWSDETLVREEPKLQYQLILSDLVHAHNEVEVSRRVKEYERNCEQRQREQLEREERKRARMSRKERFAADQRAKTQTARDIKARKAALQAAREKADLVQLRRPPLELRLFDSVVAQTLRLVRHIGHHSSRAYMLVGPPAVGKWSILHLASLITRLKVVRVNIADVSHSVHEWERWMLDVMTLCVQHVDAVGTPLIVFLKGIDNAPTFCLEAVLHAVTSGSLPRSADTTTSLLQRLHRLVDGMSRSAALHYLASRLRGGMKFVLTAVNDTMAASQTSEHQSATGSIVRLRTASWTRLVAVCRSMWVHPWPSSNLSTFSVEVLRNLVQQEAHPAMYFLAESIPKLNRPVHIRHSSMPAKLLGATVQHGAGKRSRRSPSSGSSTTTTDAHGSKQNSGIAVPLASLTPMQAEVTARLEYGAALMHNLVVSLWGSHMISMALLERCVALFWRLLKSIGPETFNSFNKCSRTVARYDEAIRIIDSNSALLDRKRPELEAKRERRAGLAETVASAAAEKETQQNCTQRASATVKEQKRILLRYREEVRGLYATVDPAVSASMRAVRGLKQTALDDIRLLPSPTYMMKLAMAGLCVMLGEAPQEDDTLPLVDKYWEPAMGLLSDASDLITMLTSYRKEDIPDIILNRIAGEPFIASPDFDFRKMRKVSAECETLVAWVHAMFRYSVALRDIRPLELKVVESEAKLDVLAKQHVVEQKKLSAKLQIDSGAREELTTITREVETLEATVTEAEDQLRRAKKIRTLFKSQYSGWVAMKNELQSAAACLHGDLLLVAGASTYLGMADSKTRNLVISAWAHALEAEQLPTSFDPDSQSPFGVKTSLVSEEVAYAWCNNGLPANRMALESAVIIHLAQEDGRWPVIIDTHGIARRWLETHYTPTAEARHHAEQLQEAADDALQQAKWEAQVAFAAEQLADSGLAADSIDSAESAASSPVEAHNNAMVASDDPAGDPVSGFPTQAPRVPRPRELRVINMALTASEIDASIDTGLRNSERLLFDSTLQSTQTIYDLRQAERFNVDFVSEAPPFLVDSSLRRRGTSFIQTGNSQAADSECSVGTATNEELLLRDGAAILRPQLHFAVQATRLTDWQDKFIGSLCPVQFTQERVTGRELVSLFRDIVVTEVAQSELKQYQTASATLLQLQRDERHLKLAVMAEFVDVGRDNFEETFRRIQRVDGQLLPLARQMHQVQQQLSTLSGILDVTQPLVERLVQLFDAAQDFSCANDIHRTLYPVSIGSFSTSIREAIRTRIRALRRQKVLQERERAAAVSDAEGLARQKQKRRRRRSANEEELDDSELGEIRGYCTRSVVQQLARDITANYFERKLLGLSRAHAASFAVLTAPRLFFQKHSFAGNTSKTDGHRRQSMESTEPGHIGTVPQAYLKSIQLLQNRNVPLACDSPAGDATPGALVSARAMRSAEKAGSALLKSRETKERDRLVADASERHNAHCGIDSGTDESSDDENDQSSAADLATRQTRIAQEISSSLQAWKLRAAEQQETALQQLKNDMKGTEHVPEALRNVVCDSDWQLLRQISANFDDNDQWARLFTPTEATDGITKNSERVDGGIAIHTLPFRIAKDAALAGSLAELLKGSPHDVDLHQASNGVNATGSIRSRGSSRPTIQPTLAQAVLKELDCVLQFLVLGALRPQWICMLSLRMLAQVSPEAGEQVERLSGGGWRCHELAVRLANSQLPICMLFEDDVSRVDVDAAIEVATRLQKTKSTVIDFAEPFVAGPAKQLARPLDWASNLASVIDRGFLSGTWVVLKNIHALALDIPSPGGKHPLQLLSNVFDRLKGDGDTVAASFRLWITIDARALGRVSSLLSTLARSDRVSTTSESRGGSPTTSWREKASEAAPSVSYVAGAPIQRQSDEKAYTRLQLFVGLMTRHSLLVNIRNASDVADSVYHTFVTAGAPFFSKPTGSVGRSTVGGKKLKPIRGFHGQKLALRLVNFHARLLHSRNMDIAPWASRASCVGGWTIAHFNQVAADLLTFDVSLEHQLTEWMQYVNVLAYVGSGLDEDSAGARALRFAIQNWRIRKIQGLMPSEVDPKIRLIAGNLADLDTRDVIGASAQVTSSAQLQSTAQTTSTSWAIPAFPVREHPCVLDVVAKPEANHVLETVASVRKRLETLCNLVGDSKAVGAFCVGDVGCSSKPFMAAGDVRTMLLNEVHCLHQFIQSCVADCDTLNQVLRVERPPSEASLLLLHALALSRVPLSWWLSSAFRHPLVGPTLLERHSGGVGRCYEPCGLLLCPWLSTLQSRAQYFTSVAAQLRDKQTGRSNMPVVQLDVFSNPVVALQAFVADLSLAWDVSPPPVWSGGFELVTADGKRGNGNGSFEAKGLTIAGLTLCGAELDTEKGLLVAACSPYYSPGSSGLILMVRAILDAGDANQHQNFFMNDSSLLTGIGEPQQRTSAASHNKQLSEPSAANGSIYRCPIYMHAGHPSAPFAFVDIPCGGKLGLPLSQCIQRQVALFIRAPA